LNEGGKARSISITNGLGPSVRSWSTQCIVPSTTWLRSVLYLLSCHELDEHFGELCFWLASGQK